MLHWVTGVSQQAVASHEEAFHGDTLETNRAFKNAVYGQIQVLCRKGPSVLSFYYTSDKQAVCSINTCLIENKK